MHFSCIHIFKRWQEIIHPLLASHVRIIILSWKLRRLQNCLYAHSFQFRQMCLLNFLHKMGKIKIKFCQICTASSEHTSPTICSGGPGWEHFLKHNGGKSEHLIRAKTALWGWSNFKTTYFEWTILLFFPIKHRSLFTSVTTSATVQKGNTQARNALNFSEAWR